MDLFISRLYVSKRREIRFCSSFWGSSNSRARGRRPCPIRLVVASNFLRTWPEFVRPSISQSISHPFSHQLTHPSIDYQSIHSSIHTLHSCIHPFFNDPLIHEIMNPTSHELVYP